MTATARLTSEAVETILRDCLYENGADRSDALKVEGVARSFGFSPAKVAENKPAIADLLSELPDEFWSDRGGGWTFLNACNDRHGRQWTGFHRVMEALFCLGIASGQAQWLLPREMWEAMPGGMPYVAITPATTATADSLTTL